MGEIELDEFEVTQAKDDILWFGDEQELVEQKLREEAADYMAVARERKRGDTTEGPSELEVQTAVEEFQAELTSDELVDLITLDDVPPPEAVSDSIQPLLDEMAEANPDFSATIGDLTVKGFTANDLSPNDPYVAADSASPAEVVVIANMRHPHFGQLRGSEGVLNFLRHCVYDALAEWQARQRTAAPDPETIKMLKDRLLRVAMQMEMHEPEVTVAEDD